MIKKGFSRLKINSLLMMLVVSSFLGVSISYSDLYLFHLILFFLVTLWLYILKSNDYVQAVNIFKIKYIKTFILIFLWYSLSLLWTPSFSLGIKYLFYLFCGIIISLSTVTICRDLKKLNNLFNVLSIFCFWRF